MFCMSSSAAWWWLRSANNNNNFNNVNTDGSNNNNNANNTGGVALGSSLRDKVTDRRNQCRWREGEHDPGEPKADMLMKKYLFPSKGQFSNVKGRILPFNSR